MGSRRSAEVILKEIEDSFAALAEIDLTTLTEAEVTDAVVRTQRIRSMADLRAMAERSAAKPADALEPRVLLHVLAGHESVVRMCELSTGQVVTPGEVLPLLDRADVERVIYDGPSKVIDIGVRRRLFTGATRTAVQLSDLSCQGPMCEVRFDRCEVDHQVPFSEGGLTEQANGRCLCKYHHRRHRPD